jgi:hypothetical protein
MSRHGAGGHREERLVSPGESLAATLGHAPVLVLDDADLDAAAHLRGESALNTRIWWLTRNALSRALVPGSKLERS